MPASGDAAPTAYDTLAYPGYAYRQTHPDRLATVASLFGMQPAPVDGCRVLELGCGDGGNLLPMALGLPGSTFVGIDLAVGAVEQARADAAALGLSNVEIRQGDLAALPDDLGEFDYVLSHGVYSWVPEAAREGILAACGRHLAPQGVAYVSYNAYPGSHLRQMSREVMRWHVRGIEAPADRIDAARELMEAIVAVDAGSGYARVMREHAERLLFHTDPLLFHDDLAEVNAPFYFHEFMADAGRHGLQFLSEADVHEGRLSGMPEDTVRVLDAATDVVDREQYLDVVKNRMFRQTLLCREGITLDRSIEPGDMRRFLVACPARAVSPVDFAPRVPMRFEGEYGIAVTSEQPIVKAALQTLSETWPVPLAFDDLLARARARATGAAGDHDVVLLADTLLEALLADFIDLHVHAPALTTDVSERPVAGRLARLQALRGDRALTTLRHATVQIEDDMAVHLVGLLDGTRDHDALVEAMREAIVSGDVLEEGVEPPPDLAEAVVAALPKLARLGLLEA